MSKKITPQTPANPGPEALPDGLQITVQGHPERTHLERSGPTALPLHREHERLSAIREDTTKQIAETENELARLAEEAAGLRQDGILARVVNAGKDIPALLVANDKAQAEALERLAALKTHKEDLDAALARLAKLWSKAAIKDKCVELRALAPRARAALEAAKQIPGIMRELRETRAQQKWLMAGLGQILKDAAPKIDSKTLKGVPYPGANTCEDSEAGLLVNLPIEEEILRIIKYDGAQPAELNLSTHGLCVNGGA